MERTELREQFFADVRQDPYANAILHQIADAWALGYEQALSDNELVDGVGHNQRHERAIEWLTEARNKAYAQALIAFAQLGRDLGEPRLPRV